MSSDSAHRPDGHPDSQLIAALEPDQLVATSSVPFGLLRLNLPWRIALGALRIFVLLITAIVVYVFVVDLSGGH